ncbi:uncharacterized protein C8Q71DRAFT_857908 [Rhodofomes roseus]|uniref:Protein BNI4 n=1 Tax=Rhodofomes roseus TaxID=34475 RepID=A0ABQ8KH79_9APHY|nr:uncharacterized protein C8Q71DRAFT_857908 [Rhodofomes roseus]KAH9836688.1 hypothetical protein C8Q71DRAFT_857908 [Rhodofomes roseus]
MAVLVSQDWQPPKEHTMDALPAPSAQISPAVPRQRSSPANDQAAPMSPAQQQPYPYPVQQQQAAWPPAHSPQQYYPAFYQNQPSYPVHAHAPQQQMNPYYDPANNQYAQWAYQQMMFNAQQAHQMSHVPQHIASQRGRSAPPPGDYFSVNQLPPFNPFPSGTPPPHPSQLPNGPYPPPDQQQAHPPQYQGFHPYRRPPRQGSSSQDPPLSTDWRPPPQSGPFQPPYVRADAAGSSTSINSSSSHSGSQRQRTNSNQGPPASPPSSHHVKSPSARGASAAASPPPAAAAAPSAPQRAHGRTSSQSSTSSAAPRAPSTSSTTTAASHGGGSATLRKPSPLSQGNFTAAEKRMSRDDSDLAAMLEPSPNAPGVRSGGLKGRLRRALSLGANNTLHEEDEGEDEVPKNGAPPPAGSSQATITGDDESTATVQKKKSRSLFNSRLNRSTDNISLSSTMSSASMVIRKLGNIGKLTRRNSLAGITSLFKDKKDKEDEEATGPGAAAKKSKKKKGEKGAPADPSVSMATAELDRSEYASPELAGLSPAARLARQHTLKSNAEAAARAKADAEARAAAAAAAQNGEQADVPATWEKNTTTRQGEGAAPGGPGARRVNEEGMGVVDDNSDSGSDEGPLDRHPQSYSMDGWDDDDDWNEAHEDEDMTIRAELEAATLEDHHQAEMEPWAVNVRRSVEKARKPAKGILKTRADYEQPDPPFARMRSNSYDSAPSRSGELGPLARIPSPDPDHIDGLHKHNAHGPHHGQANSNGTFIPPLSFEHNGLALDSPKDSTDTSSVSSGATEKGLFTHPNSSAPALSTMFSPNPPTLSQRSATAPAKRLAFASNLSVYDTFPATVYDRRSEPATWSRLTPALAQRIKEELNSYKMEEMEVHAASRVHTQFFV